MKIKFQPIKIPDQEPSEQSSKTQCFPTDAYTASGGCPEPIKPAAEVKPEV